MEARYFLTVDWCNKGRRGVFCDKDGRAFGKPMPYTEEEIWDILGPFDIILSPRSEKFTEDQLAQFNTFMPLAEYKNQYGIAIIREQQ